MKKRAIVIILFLIVLLTYPVFKIRSAHDRVKQLYHQVSVGMPIGQVEEEAKKLRLKVIKSEADGSNPGNVIAWDGWAFARWNCFIEYANGKALSKQILFLD